MTPFFRDERLYWTQLFSWTQQGLDSLPRAFFSLRWSGSLPLSVRWDAGGWIDSDGEQQCEAVCSVNLGFRPQVLCTASPLKSHDFTSLPVWTQTQRLGRSRSSPVLQNGRQRMTTDKSKTERFFLLTQSWRVLYYCVVVVVVFDTFQSNKTPCLFATCPFMIFDILKVTLVFYFYLLFICFVLSSLQVSLLILS